MSTRCFSSRRSNLTGSAARRCSTKFSSSWSSTRSSRRSGNWLRYMASGRGSLAVAAFGLASGASRVVLAGAPHGQLTWGVHVSLAPTWFDPAETPGIVTPFMVLYALHDAMVKPMPGQPMAASLAESWSASEDALIYEFVLREGLKFHNGEPVTAEDVKFSFERYRGTSHDLMKARVASVEAVDA